jgi:hypothetical protein
MYRIGCAAKLAQILTTDALFWAHIHLLIASPCACRTSQFSPAFLRHSALPPSLPPSFLDSYIPFMPVDIQVIDLRQWAGNLAYRLGSLNRFSSAAQELLDIIHHLSSEILLQHSRKVGSELIFAFSPMLTDNHTCEIVTLVEVDIQLPIADPRLRRAAAE